MLASMVMRPSLRPCSTTACPRAHPVVARADEKLAAGATAELLDTLGTLLFPSQEEAEV